MSLEAPQRAGGETAKRQYPTLGIVTELYALAERSKVDLMKPVVMPKLSQRAIIEAFGVNENKERMAWSRVISPRLYEITESVADVLDNVHAGGAADTVRRLQDVVYPSVHISGVTVFPDTQTRRVTDGGNVDLVQLSVDQDTKIGIFPLDKFHIHATANTPEGESYPTAVLDIQVDGDKTVVTVCKNAPSAGRLLADVRFTFDKDGKMEPMAEHTIDQLRTVAEIVARDNGDSKRVAAINAARLADNNIESSQA